MTNKATLSTVVVHRPSVTGLTLVLSMIAASTVSAIASDRPGRFVMSPIDGGFARLDTETGAMSVCKAQPGAAAWSCTPMADGAAMQEARTRKLETDNADLRAEIKRMEDQLGLNGPKAPDDAKRAERPASSFGLPSEQDVDKALSYLERMVRKLQDTMRRLDRTPAGEDGRKGIAM